MSDDKLEIRRDRIERLIDVLSLVSIGDFDPERTTIEVEREDEFGALQESMKVFIGELVEARRKTDEAMQKLVASRAELEEKLETIESQRTLIRDLSTPVIEVWDDIITLPVVGLVDAERSAEMTEKLLSRIVHQRAKCVIIDLTGVEIVDTTTAHYFITMIDAARLLGAYCVITGIRPAIAQTLSSLGNALDRVPTLQNLKEGIRECFRHLQASDTRRTKA